MPWGRGFVEAWSTSGAEGSWVGGVEGDDRGSSGCWRAVSGLV